MNISCKFRWSFFPARPYLLDSLFYKIRSRDNTHQIWSWKWCLLTWICPTERKYPYVSKLRFILQSGWALVHLWFGEFTNVADRIERRVFNVPSQFSKQGEHQAVSENWRRIRDLKLLSCVGGEKHEKLVSSVQLTKAMKTLSERSARWKCLCCCSYILHMLPKMNCERLVVESWWCFYFNPW